MVSSTKPTQPIMTPDQERFMAFEGVLQWAQAVILQAERLSALHDQTTPHLDAKAWHQELLARHTECHFFAVAAHQFIEHRNWALTYGLFSTIDFAEIDQFSASGHCHVNFEW